MQRVAVCRQNLSRDTEGDAHAMAALAAKGRTQRPRQDRGGPGSTPAIPSGAIAQLVPSQSGLGGGSKVRRCASVRKAERIKA